jgi:hypothetical protein
MILSVFGLRVQVRTLVMSFTCLMLTPGLLCCTVILVAQRLPFGHLLCRVYGCELFDAPLLREGKAVIVTEQKSACEWLEA